MPSPSTYVRGLLITAALAVSARAPARPAEYAVNVREACRLAISGGYLQAYDERERVTAMVQALDRQGKELDEAIRAAQAEAKDAADAAQASEFEVKLAARRDETASVVAGLVAQRAETARERAQAQASLAGRTAEEKRLRALVGRVFTFERLNDEPDGGYPLHITYRAPCPKYRALCPLPLKDAEQLVAITLGGSVPEPCSRYANFARIH